MVDTLFDLQQSINKAVMDMQDIRARTAKGGGKVMDPSIFGNDKSKMDRFVAMGSLPGYAEFSEPNAFQGGKEKYILELPESKISQDHFAFFNSLFRMVDMLTTPAATEGRGEGTRETGKLFQSKYEAGLIAHGDFLKAIEIHQWECATAYYNQARIQYKGSPRKFAGYGDKEPFIINQKMNGEVVDDIAKLPRCKVVITQSPKSLNMRSIQREMYGDMINHLPKDSVVMPYICMYGVLDTLDAETPQTIEAKRLLQKEKENAESKIDASKAQNKLNEEMAKNQLKAMQNQGVVQPNPILATEPGAAPGAGPEAPPLTAESIPPTIPEALPPALVT